MLLSYIFHFLFPQVISRKDQAQYWFHNELPHSFVSVDMFHEQFKESPFGKKLEEDLSELYDKSESKKSSVSFAVFSLSRWELFKACMSRELLLAKRNYFLYLFKTIQVTFLLPYSIYLHSSSLFYFIFLGASLYCYVKIFLATAYYYRNHDNDSFSTDWDGG